MHTKGRAQLAGVNPPTANAQQSHRCDDAPENPKGNWPTRLGVRKTRITLLASPRAGPTVLRDIDAYLGLPTLRGAPLSLPAARAVLDAQAKDTLSRKCRDGTGTWNASLPDCPAERSIQLYRTHESVPLDTLLGGVAGGRVRVDQAVARHPLLRAMWGCFKPPRCAADGVLRPTRAAYPAGVEL